MTRVLLALALLLLVVGGVATLLRGSDPDRPSEALEHPEAGSEPEPPDLVTLRGRGAPASPTGEINAGSAGEDATPPGEEAAPKVPATRRLEGLVTDERDVPVAGVQLRVAPSPFHGSQALTLSDAEGRFLFPDFPNCHAQVEVQTGEDWAPVRPVAITADQASMHVRLTRAVSVRIQVLDAAGRPASGVRIEVVGIRLSEEATSSVGVRPAEHADGEGATVVGGLPPGGTLELHVGGGKWPGVRFRDVVVGPDECVLRLPPSAVLAGVLVDEEGRPLGDIRILAAGCDPGVWNMRRQTETEARTGRFIFDVLAPGRYRLDVVPPAGLSARHEPRFVHAPRTDLRVRLPRLVRVTGRVEAEDPTQVTVVWCAGGARISRTPDAAGAFLYAELPNLPATLYARHEASGAAALLEGVRPDEGPFTIRLEPAGLIRGRVPGMADTRHGEFLIGARRGPLLIEGRLHAGSTFSIPGVPPGTWVVELWEDGGCSRVEGVESGATDVVLTLPSPVEGEAR